MASQGPIQHVVVIFKENHTFDNYFGTLPGANGAMMAHAPNPPTHDPDHRHKAWLNRTTGAVREQYLESDIPVYFAYARQFTLCDNYFTDVAGPSTPNHLMVLAADSPVIDNPSGNPVYDLPSLPASLDENERLLTEL
jgi:phospholipase C